MSCRPPVHMPRRFEAGSKNHVASCNTHHHRWNYTIYYYIFTTVTITTHYHGRFHPRTSVPACAAGEMMMMMPICRAGGYVNWFLSFNVHLYIYIYVYVCNIYFQHFFSLFFFYTRRRRRRPVASSFLFIIIIFYSKPDRANIYIYIPAYASRGLN